MRMTAEPVEEAHRKTKTAHKTQMGVANWSIQMANKEYNKYLIEIAEILHDEDKLLELGFTAAYHEGESAEDYPDDVLIAGTVVDLIRATMAHELKSMRTHSCIPPLGLLNLRSHSTETKEECLEGAASLLNALHVFQELAVGIHWFYTHLRDMVWPASVWVYEALTSLAEAEFKHVPRDIVSRLDSLLMSWMGSVVAENGFKKLSECSFQHRAGQLGRLSRWHRLVAGTLLTEYDRKPAPSTPISKASQARCVKAGVFERRIAKATFSLGSDVPDMIKSDDRTGYADTLCKANLHASMKRMMGRLGEIQQNYWTWKATRPKS